MTTPSPPDPGVTEPGRLVGPALRRSGAGRPLARVIGAVVAAWGGVLLATYGAFLTPLRIGSVLVPLSVALAMLGNALLARFAYAVTGSRLIGLLPGLIWLVLSMLWSNRTTEGDLVLANTWVSTLYLFLGLIPTVVAAYRWFVTAPPR